MSDSTDRLVQSTPPRVFTSVEAARAWQQDRDADLADQIRDEYARRADTARHSDTDEGND